MNPTPVCLDSSVVAKWVFPESRREEALRLLALHESGLFYLVAPDNFSIERISIARHKYALGAVPLEVCRESLQDLMALQVRLIPTASMSGRVFEIANLINERAWDAAYIAVAEAEGCEFWTADRELAQRAKAHFPFVKLLGEDTIEKDELP